MFGFLVFCLDLDSFFSVLDRCSFSFGSGFGFGFLDFGFFGFQDLDFKRLSLFTIQRCKTFLRDCFLFGG